MKFGIISKSTNLTDEQKNKDLQLINQFSRKELTLDDVYTFPVVMCNNDIDRDIERFSIDTLKGLAKLFKGKTMIFDHYPTATNQVARVYDTHVEEVAGQKTKDGEVLTNLVGKVYMLKNDSNMDLINSIDAGILKEVSISCSVEKCICSICGTDKKKERCEHIRGKTYKGKLCYISLEKATDAYELSLVAIPAQKGAGITKMFIDDNNESEVNNLEILAKIKEQFGVEIKSDETLENALTAISKSYKEPEKVDIKVVDNEDGSKSVMNGETEIKKFELPKADTDTELKAKADMYDEIKKSAVDDALKNGIKAKGEVFDNDRWSKVFNGFSIAEIKAQSDEWLDDAKKMFNAGSRLTENEDDGIAKSHKKINYDF